MARVLLADRHHGQTVAAAFGGQVEVHDFRELAPQQGHEDLVERDAQHGRFVGRLARIGGVIDGVAPHRDAFDREDGEPVLLVVVAGVVAVRAFQRHLVVGIGRRVRAFGHDRLDGARVGGRQQMAFQHDLGPGRHGKVAAQRLRDLGARAAQQAGELVFGQAVRHGRDGAQRGGRVGAQRDRDGEGRAGVRDGVVAEIQRAAAMRQPAHDELVGPQQLLAIDAQVLALRVGAACDHQPPGQEGRHVPGPAGLDRQAGQVHVLALPDDFLAGGAFDVLGAHVPERGLQHGHLGQRIAQAFRGLGFTQRGQQLADVAQGADAVGAHAPGYPRRRAEQVRQHRHLRRGAVVPGIFKQQGGALGAQHAVGNFGHFQPGRDRRGDAFQVAHPFKLGEEVSKVAVFHYRSQRFGYISGSKRG
ncbi:hypothetical protein D3C85_642960 [compost metagenome]